MTEASTPVVEDTTVAGPEAGQLRHLDPRTLEIGDNVREYPNLTKTFLSSIAAHGVLVPLTALERRRRGRGPQRPAPRRRGPRDRPRQRPGLRGPADDRRRTVSDRSQSPNAAETAAGSKKPAPTQLRAGFSASGGQELNLRPLDARSGAILIDFGQNVQVRAVRLDLL